MNGLSNSFEKKQIVISGINLFQGGPLSIYYDFLDAVVEHKIDKHCEIIAFVHRLSLFDKYNSSNIKFIELPKSRSSYLMRYYYEYIFFKRWSRKRSIDVWISLHDITPSVKAKKIYTYCHNPSPFRKLTKLDFKTGLKNVLFPIFYKHIYKKNIKKATGIIVQQEWIRKKFIELFKVDNVIVAAPSIVMKDYKKDSYPHNKVLFFYPALPRSFKNHIAICEAVKRIVAKDEDLDFEVVFTIKGNENKYSKYLFKKYSNIKNIIWAGQMTRQEVFDMYTRSDCLLFPSLIETWGLPIAEFKKTNKGILLADALYSRETIDEYKNVSFFNPNDYQQLADLMKKVMDKSIVYDGNCSFLHSQPFAASWKELITMIFSDTILC